ncbi:hypothetical protein C8Q70DRAFT_698580 [Cubamyces menziesii]|nr:hypothetical protein C8Q70DRAFT_698580 [Cubamyces menziesii]
MAHSHQPSAPPPVTHPPCMPSHRPPDLRPNVPGFSDKLSAWTRATYRHRAGSTDRLPVHAHFEFSLPSPTSSAPRGAVIAMVRRFYGPGACVRLRVPAACGRRSGSKPPSEPYPCFLPRCVFMFRLCAEHMPHAHACACAPLLDNVSRGCGEHARTDMRALETSRLDRARA